MLKFTISNRQSLTLEIVSTKGHIIERLANTTGIDGTHGIVRAAQLITFDQNLQGAPGFSWHKVRPDDHQLEVESRLRYLIGAIALSSPTHHGDTINKKGSKEVKEQLEIAGQVYPSLSGIPLGLCAGFKLGGGDRDKDRERDKDETKNSPTMSTIHPNRLTKVARRPTSRTVTSLCRTRTAGPRSERTFSCTV
ncbi:hypothetical protein BGW80DRAFT_114652 [Lactifluus volemus]|nr:hypothetical protein BGW80DRAFT_114652 [Lactifluus volemus]